MVDHSHHIPKQVGNVMQAAACLALTPLVLGKESGFLMNIGMIDDSRTYTLAGLAEALGYRQSRSLERLLAEIGCPVARLGKKKLVSGHQFRQSIERKSENVHEHQALDRDPAQWG